MTDESDNLIYHYCPADAFLGIVQSKAIWLTNIFYMNDAEEHYYLRKIVSAVIEERRQEEEPLNHVLEYFDSLKTKVEPEGVAGIYCACFSKQWDSLGQWRAYADDGRGFAIGFCSHYFLRTLRPDMELVHVIYCEEEQKRIAENLLEQPLESLRSLPPRPPGLSPSTITWGEGGAQISSQQVRWELWRQATTCKNPAFEEEQEVRIIYHPGMREADRDCDPLGFRSAGALLIPYYPLKVDPKADPHPIKRIVFGPKNPAALNEASLRMLLTMEGFPVAEMEFDVSRASLR